MIAYERPARLEYEAEQSKRSNLAVTVIAGGDTAVEIFKRKPNLVIALDSGFKVVHEKFIKSRFKPGTCFEATVPSVRLNICTPVEYLELCLPRTLAPNDDLQYIKDKEVMRQIYLDEGSISPRSLTLIRTAPWTRSRPITQMMRIAI